MKTRKAYLQIASWLALFVSSTSITFGQMSYFTQEDPTQIELVSDVAQEEELEEGEDQPSVCDGLDENVFCDDFNSPELDLEKWWYGRNQWGNGKEYKNHGVVPENVIVKDGKVFFGANGDNYTGDIKGVRKENPDFIQDQSGSRTGGILISDDYMGSGRYEVRMKLPKELGVCTAIWTFHYQEVYQDDPSYEDYIAQGYEPQGSDDDGWYVTPNHEIDIEIPTALKGEDQYEKCSYRNARLNTWIGELNYTDRFIDMGLDQNDGEFHDYRFDWHTGGDGEEPRVEFYIDGKHIYTSTKHIPFIKGRFTIGTWFPQWSGGKADFDRVFTEVDWIKITPFNEPNDKKIKESFKNAGMTKCQNQSDNDKYLRKCRLSSF